MRSPSVSAPEGTSAPREPSITAMGMIRRLQDDGRADAVGLPEDERGKQVTIPQFCRVAPLRLPHHPVTSHTPLSTTSPKTPKITIDVTELAPTQSARCRHPALHSRGTRAWYSILVMIASRTMHAHQTISAHVILRHCRHLTGIHPLLPHSELSSMSQLMISRSYLIHSVRNLPRPGSLTHTPHSNTVGGLLRSGITIPPTG